MAAIGTRKTSAAAAVEALKREGAFETVESARAALWKLTAADWVYAISQGVKRRERTAMKLFAQACKLLGQEGELLQAFLAQYGLATIEAVHTILDHAQASRDAPPEQTDRDCIEWLEARGYRVARQAQAIEQATPGQRKARQS